MGKRVTSTMRRRRWARNACSFREQPYVIMRALFAALSPVALGQADVPGRGDDDVVQDLDPAEVADLAQSLRHLDVGCRRRGIARRVVVTEDHRSGAQDDESPEDVP